MKMYGNLTNRLEENRVFCKEIKVGTGVTEYLWSDRECYEVIEVKDQKHVTVRKYTAKHVGGPYENEWELISDEKNAVKRLEKRGNRWYWTATVRREDVEDIPETEEGSMIRLRLAVAGFDIERILQTGKQTRRVRANVSFGVADYYYDYEF